MTIRYQCEKCDSVLKIKDELAGTEGKCPKCKTKFTVPEPAEASPAANGQDAPAKAKPASPAKNSPGKKKAAASPGKGANDDEFDPVAFLMDDEAPGARTSAGLASAQESEPAAPNVDAQGRRKWGSSGKTNSADASPAAASADSAINASANARDLLTKTMEDSRVRAASMPEESREPRFDFRGFGAMLLRGAPMIGGIIVAAIGLYWVSSYMMGASLPLPELATVSGTVTLDGDPLPNVTVQLTPVSPEGQSTSGKEITLRTASGTTDQNGYYTVSYMSGVQGAPVGKVRIWIAPVDPTVFTKIPPQYLRPSNDIREVRQAGNEGKFNLELSSPTASR